MELFLPSFFIVILALGFVFAVLPRMGPFMMAILAAIALFLAVRHHRAVFKQDYETMTWTTGAASAAPYILVGVVILFSIGYLLFLWGAGKKTNLPAPPMVIPPPESATNILTSAIGNGLKATGLATVGSLRNTAGRSASANTAQLESVASKIA